VSYQQQIVISTKGHGDMRDLTEQVAAIVTSSGIQTGTVNIFTLGSTAAIGTIEFEPGLQHDLPAILDKLIRSVALTAMSKPGMMATATRICRPRCSGHR